MRGEARYKTLEYILVMIYFFILKLKDFQLCWQVCILFVRGRVTLDSMSYHYPSDLPAKITIMTDRQLLSPASSILFSQNCRSLSVFISFSFNEIFVSSEKLHTVTCDTVQYSTEGRSIYYI